MRAALKQDELVVLGDLLREAHAAVAEDAALAVDRDQRRQLERLLEVALGLDEARGARARAVGDVLQRALAALVADRAVERVVDEQELDHRALGVVHALGLRVDDHAVLDRRRARGLQLRDPLDLDQAHAAGADGLAELGLVTEDGDLDVAVLAASTSIAFSGAETSSPSIENVIMWIAGRGTRPAPPSGRCRRARASGPGPRCGRSKTTS